MIPIKTALIILKTVLITTKKALITPKTHNHIENSYDHIQAGQVLLDTALQMEAMAGKRLTKAPSTAPAMLDAVTCGPSSPTLCEP